MLRTLRLLIVPVALLVVGSVSGLAAQEDVARPDTVSMDGGRLGQVTFSHAAHETMTDCVACHHESRPEKPATERYQPCDACHVSQPVAPMTTSIRDAFHDVRAQSGVCIDCHKSDADTGAAAPVRCNECHVRRPQ